MTHILRPASVTAFLLFAIGCGAPNSDAAPRRQDILAIVDVNVIPMDSERVLPGQTVIIEDGRIAAIGPSAEIDPPAGSTIVPGEGRYLLPGIAEMHAHIPSASQGEEAIERTLFLYVANGVTTIRGMLGEPSHLELRDRAARNEIISPRIYTSGPSFNGNSVPDAATAMRMVEEQAAAGYDFLKIHPGVPREAYDSLASTAHRLGISFAGHVPAGVGLDRAMEARQRSIDHLDAYIEALAGAGDGFSPRDAGFFGFGMIDDADESLIPELARRTAEAGVWNAPTLTLIEHLFDPTDPAEMARRPEIRYVPEATVLGWVDRKRGMQLQPGFTRERADRYIALRRQLVRELYAAGAGIILASDAPQWWNVPGFSLQHEMRMMVAAGLTPYQVLETATRKPAEYFGAADWGVIREGAAADLVLVGANPLDDIANMADVHGVVLRGRWISRDAIRAGLDAIAAAVR